MGLQLREQVEPKLALELEVENHQGRLKLVHPLHGLQSRPSLSANLRARDAPKQGLDSLPDDGVVINHKQTMQQA